MTAPAAKIGALPRAEVHSVPDWTPVQVWPERRMIPTWKARIWQARGTRAFNSLLARADRSRVPARADRNQNDQKGRKDRKHSLPRRVRPEWPAMETAAIQLKGVSKRFLTPA